METLELIDENRRILKVHRIDVENARGGSQTTESKEIPIDDFQDEYQRSELGIVKPPYNLLSLAVMPETSSDLASCVDAMKVNIDSLGHRIIPRSTITQTEEELDSDIKSQLYKVRNFFSNAVLEGTFTDFRQKLRIDYEETGNAYIEVLTNLMTGEPAGLNHIPSWTIRLRKLDDYPTDYDVHRAVQTPQGKWIIEKFPHRRRFRRYIQKVEHSSKLVYFKEWGDPRNIDNQTGEVLSDEQLQKYGTSRLANSMLHMKLYSPRTPYGLPRWISTLFAIYGSRRSEKINYTTLSNNNIPSFIMMATNVQLTSGSLKRIKEFVEERVQKEDNYSTFLIIEGEPLSSESLRDPGTMKLDIKPLQDTQMSDAMFINYIDKNGERVRCTFRLPPIFIGKAEDYTRATVEASLRSAESQIFSPERQAFDGLMNVTIVPAIGGASTLYVSNTPNVTDNFELTQLLAVAERSGGLNPNISRMIVEDVLGKELPEVSEKIDADIPFTLTMLREQQALQTGEDSSDTRTQKRLDIQLLNQFKFLDSLMTENIPKEVVTYVKRTIRLLERICYD